MGWTLASYKYGLEIRKLHQEIAKLTREAKRDRESSALVQPAPRDVPEGFVVSYGTRDRILRKIQEEERIAPRFSFETPDDE